MLRGLPATLSEAELAATVASYRPVGVRLITDRGFGFIEFTTIPEAERFVKENLDTLSIQGRYIHIDYSHGAKRDDGRSGGTGTRLDWLCGHCGAHNFARRAMCFQCTLPKDELATVLRDSYYQPDGKEEPNPVLVVLGLGPETGEESIRYVFQAFAPIVDVRVMRDKTSGGGSRGFAFVQFSNTEDARLALNRSKGIMIDGRSVRVSFSRDQGKAAKAAWQDPKMWERPANLSESFKFDKKSGQYFDKQSGFYYDPASCLYYHGTTGVHYRWDAVSNQYLQVDERGVAISTDAVPQSNATPSQAAKDGSKGGETSGKLKQASDGEAKKSTKKDGKKRKKKGLGSIAFSFKKGPAKQKPVTAKVQPEQPPEKDVAEMAAAAARAAAAASAALAALKPAPAPSAATNSAPPWANLSGAAPGTLKPPVESLPDDLQAQRGHFQLGKKICALCKRKFPSMDKLFQHARKSALHKKNLELVEIKRVADAERVARSKPPPRRTERPREDRRRNKKRQEASSGSSAFEDMVSKAASVKKPIDDSNKGSKMLKAMGWKKGQGLGKDSSGITAPVNAEIHVRGAGLGSAPTGRHAILPGDNYQNAGIKKARARFERAAPGFSSGRKNQKKPTSAASAYLAAMNEYQSTMCTEKDEYARAMLK